MGKRPASGLPRYVKTPTEADGSSDVLNKRVFLLTTLLNALWCVNGKDTCPDDVDTVLSDLRRCLPPDCAARCRTAVNVRNCVARMCGSARTDAVKDMADEPLRSAETGIRNLALKGAGDVKPKRSDELDVYRFGLGQSRNKRYRLGLYDCISSYCGNLHGEDRKSCIVNYCHRSSTLKM